METAKRSVMSVNYLPWKEKPLKTLRCRKAAAAHPESSVIGVFISSSSPVTSPPWHHHAQPERKSALKSESYDAFFLFSFRRLLPLNWKFLISSAHLPPPSKPIENVPLCARRMPECKRCRPKREMCNQDIVFLVFHVISQSQKVLIKNVRKQRLAVRGNNEDGSNKGWMRVSFVPLQVLFQFRTRTNCNLATLTSVLIFFPHLFFI